MIMLMERIIIACGLGLLGLVLGSFAGASVWRLRARQLVDDKDAGEKVDKKEYKMLEPLTATTIVSDRSRCLHCGHQLEWYDLIPLASWLSTRGNCRYCGKRIGWFEPLMELGTAVFFAGSYIFWPALLVTPMQVMYFVLWLIAGVGLVMLFAYDLKWFILPNRVIFPLFFVAGLAALFNILGSLDHVSTVIDVLIAVMILSGLYLILWLVSKGRWIGFGDVKLGLVLALLLSDWKLAFIALFAANLLGCLIVIPALLTKQITRKTRVPFGPLLIVGTIIAAWWGPAILAWYFAAFA